MQRRILIILCGLAAGLAARPAVAQKAEATAAFQRGQQLKQEGKVAEACTAFEHSMKLDAQFGTQYNLALCYLALGRTASAWAELDELSNKDPNRQRRADAARRARELRPRLTSVLVKLTRPMPQLTVTRDGIDVSVLVGAPMPVDPGPHRFVAIAPGHRAWSTELAFTGEGKTIDVIVPELEPDAAAPPGEPAQSPPRAPPAGSTGIAQTDGSSPGRGRRIAGIATFSAGTAGLVIGTVYGLRALNRGDSARRACGGDLAQCTGDAEAARRLVDDGRGFAQISNVALLAGGALAAAGVVLYVTAPRGVTAQPSVAPGAVGLMVSGRF